MMDIFLTAIYQNMLLSSLVKLQGCATKIGIK